MRFTAYASGSSGNLYAVDEAGADAILIECGLPYRQMREALFFNVSRLAGVLISHHHQDHSRAVRQIMRAGVDCYMSEDAWDALGVSGHRAKVLKPLHLHPIEDWDVMPFDARHDAAGALGFLIIAPSGERLLYACDTACVKYRFRDVSIIAIEANFSSEKLRTGNIPAAAKRRIMRTHMSIERVLAFLKANDLSSVREIWLLHLSDSNSDADEFASAVAEATGIRTCIAPRRADVLTEGAV